jgi:hypothetical protein
MHIKNRDAYAALIVGGLITRIPFFRLFGLVTYDGTYYINQAKSILEGPYLQTGFPIGYPLFIALFKIVTGDGVMAARMVSIITGIGLPILVYELGKHYLEKREALVAALILMVNPLSIRLSMITMSEMLFVFWVFAGLLLFVRSRELPSGISMGLAAITRPEALGIFGIMALARIRNRRPLLLFVAGFALIYSVNVAVQSGVAKKFVPLPKAGLFGTHSISWQKREAWIDFEGKDELMARATKEWEKDGILTDYIKTVPGEFLLLTRLAMPPILLLALFAAFRRRLIFLSTFAPFLLYPLFTLRSEPRFLFPYLPGVCLYAMVGVGCLKKKGVRIFAFNLVIASAILGILINLDQLSRRYSGTHHWARETGERFSDIIGRDDRIADRKPYFAFYAGGKYVEIPVGPYDVVIDHLASEGVEYLVTHRKTIHAIRPFLRGLLYDRALINGEFRYSQIHFEENVVMIYRRTGRADPLEISAIVPKQDISLTSSSLSPDGERTAFRMFEQSGAGGIFYLTEDGKCRLLVTEQQNQDILGWSPDSKAIAFASRVDDNIDIYIHEIDGKTKRVTRHEGIDMSPSWSPGGKEIAFNSNRSGQHEIWMIDMSSGRIHQISNDGGNRFPSYSPDGGRIAWIKEGRGVVVYELESGVAIQLPEPAGTFFAPAWSPDGRYIAVTGSDWGAPGIYLLSPDGGGAILLTKSSSEIGYPSWSPDGRSITAVSIGPSGAKLVRIAGIEPYLERLTDPVRSDVFDRRIPFD